MTYYEEDVDDCRSWEDVAFSLSEPWRQARDPVADVRLTTHFDQLLVEEPSSASARQRQGLHRLGFRRKGDRCWAWTPPSPPWVDVPSPSAGVPAFIAAASANMRLSAAIDLARGDMAMRVLREVFACIPEHLVITLVHEAEDSEWEDEDDDERTFTPLDCSALEIRGGRGPVPH